MSDANSSVSLAETLSIIQHKIIQTVYPLYLAFGLTGCILNLIIFASPKLRKTSCCTYFFAASTDHLFTLIVGIGTVFYGLNNPDPQITSLTFCKVRGYIFQITLMLSRWFVAFACIDRYASSSHAIRLRNFANRRIAKYIIVIITIFWSIICTHRLIFYEIRNNNCGIFTNMAAAIYHSAYVIIGGGILPATIMATCAFLIRRNIRQKREQRARRRPIRNTRGRFDQQVHNLLFVQIICYIIFTIPQLCNLSFAAFSISVSNKSTDRLAIEKFINFVAELFLYLFPVSSFYLYTLTSPTFRKELVNCLRYLPILRKFFRQRIIPMESLNTVTRNVERQLTTIQNHPKRADQ